MRASDLRNSNYLEEDDVTPPILVTIKSEEPREFKNRDGSMDKKAVLGFEETDKMLVCNITNFKHITKFTGLKDSEDWIGQKIVIWYNPDIEMAGEIVGGIRVRAPKQTLKNAVKDAQDFAKEKQAQINAEQDAGIPEDDSEVPF